MPRQAAVSPEELLTSLKKFNIFSAEGCLLNQKNQVWDDVRQDIECRMSTKYIWQYVHEDRHSVQSDIRTHLHLPPLVRNINEEKEQINEDIHTDEDHVQRVLPKKIFVVKIDPETWKKIEPTAHEHYRSDRSSKLRTELRLPEGWKTVLQEEFYNQHFLPCAYRFEAQVNMDPSLASCFVSIRGNCPDCCGEGSGKIFVRPAPGEVVLLEWISTDSRNLHHSSKAQLRGSRRFEIGKECAAASSSSYRRTEAAKTMVLGSPESPLLSKGPALRKAAQNFRDSKLFVTKEEDEITTVEKMKRTVPFAGAIHDIGSDRIVIPYDTHSQLLVYKTFRKSSYCRLTADATGSLIERVPRRVKDAGLSRHLFLYELVLSGEGIQLPVAQLISERQDSDCLTYWIKEWLRRGGQVPDEIVCDASAALLATFASAFGKAHGLKNYLEIQFLCLTGQSAKPAKCFLRKDVAHLTNNICKWKVWSTDGLKKVRDFFVRCFAVLVQCTTLEKFKDFLTCILIVCQSPTIGFNCDGDPVAAERSLQKLADAIASANTFDLSVVNDNPELERANQHPDDFDNFLEDDVPSCIKDFIEDITVSASLKAKEEGDRISPYNNDKVYLKYVEYAHDFVLWTGVMVPLYKSPFLRPSSAASESSFSDLKCRILKDVSKPMQLHKMLQKHLKHIDGAVKLISASIPDSSNATADTPATTAASTTISTIPATGIAITECTSTTVTTVFTSTVSSIVTASSSDSGNNANNKRSRNNDQSDCDSGDDTSNLFSKGVKENWKNLADKGRKSRKKVKFFTPSAETRLAVENETLTPPTIRLLKNGNLLGSCNLGPNFNVILKNTDIIDSVLHIIAAAYIDFSYFRESANKEADHLLLQCAISLATVGAVAETYASRAKLALKFLQSEDLNPPTTRKRQDVTSKIVDCQGNLMEQCKILLHQLPACIINTSCTSDKVQHLSEIDMIILEPAIGTLLSNGIIALAVACNDAMNCMNDTPCHEGDCVFKLVTDANLNQFVFVDLSTSLGMGRMKKEYDLQEIPPEIEIGSKEEHFRLIGLITHQNKKHLVCYTRNLQNLWHKYDNIRSGVISVTPEVKIAPVSLCYIKMPKEN